MFRLDPGANTCGTYLLDVMELPPALLVACFGPPGRHGYPDCMGAWSFMSDRGEVFTLYEYKSTSAFEQGAPAPEGFWALPVPHGMHIGGHRGTDLAGFKHWLLARVRKARREGVALSHATKDFCRDCVKEYLKNLTPAERQEVLRSLSPEERLHGLAPEVIEQFLKQLKAAASASPHRRRRQD